MDNSVFYFVTLKASVNILESIKVSAFDKFHAIGIEEFSLSEDEVDKILGERAYSGGDIPLEVLNEVEEKTLLTDESITIYFKDKEDALKFCHYLEKETSCLDFSLREGEHQDWNEKWRRHFKPISINNKLAIIPEWEMTEEKKNSEIYIYPGMGFGTGGHQTTHLCLKFFTELEDGLWQKNCLDFGCGSGILGIAAIKLSNMVVDFCDIDINALENCKKNLELNFDVSTLSGSRIVSRKNYKSQRKYDLIFANILNHILEMEKLEILNSLNRDGYLILSGILNDQVDSLKKVYHELDVLKVESMGDWSAILMRWK